MKYFSRKRLPLFVVLICAPLQFALAQDQPLWAAGIGVLAVQLSAYRGAVESSTDVLPIPYIIYRGEYLKADKDGIRGVLFDTDKFEINLSFAASPPVRSNTVKVRNDMPDLSASLELGPTLDVKLWQSAQNATKLRLFVPVRAALTLGSDPHFIGWQIAPRLNLDIDNPFGLPGWTLGTVGGPSLVVRSSTPIFTVLRRNSAVRIGLPTRPKRDLPDFKSCRLCGSGFLGFGSEALSAMTTSTGLSSKTVHWSPRGAVFRVALRFLGCWEYPVKWLP